MNTEVIFLFIILLLGIVFVSFLGGATYKEGLTNNKIVYKGPNGDTAILITNDDGTEIIKGTNQKGEQFIFNQSPTTANLFVDSTGVTAKISGNDIVFKNPINGETTTFASSATNDTSLNANAPPSNTPANSIPLYGNLLTNSSQSNSFDNYNHFNGSGSSIQLQNGTVFTDAAGNTITVGTNSDGTQNLQFQLAVSDDSHVFNSTSQTVTSATNTFTSASGKIKAKAIIGNDGQIAIQLDNGNTTSIFLQQGSKSNTQNQSNITNTQYYGSTGYSVNPTSYSKAYTDNSNNKNGQNVTYNPNDVNVPQMGISSYGNTYYSTLPPGIPKSDIPPGHEDLYILKSQIVPPVCPVCPTCSNSRSNTGSVSVSSADDANLYSNLAAGSAYGDKKCPPCPACARCPESSFDCKKVPNYNAINNDYLPQPVLSDFSQFGM